MKHNLEKERKMNVAGNNAEIHTNGKENKS